MPRPLRTTFSCYLKLCSFCRWTQWLNRFTFLFISIKSIAWKKRVVYSQQKSRPLMFSLLSFPKQKVLEDFDEVNFILHTSKICFIYFNTFFILYLTLFHFFDWGFGLFQTVYNQIWTFKYFLSGNPDMEYKFVSRSANSCHISLRRNCFF